MRGKHRKFKAKIIHWQRAKWLGKPRLPADRTKVKLAPWSQGYGLNAEYVDKAFRCQSCQKYDVWTAADQKTYFELWGHIYREQNPRRCRKCRAARRRAIQENNARTIEGLRNQPPEKQNRYLPKTEPRYSQSYRPAE